MRSCVQVFVRYKKLYATLRPTASSMLVLMLAEVDLCHSCLKETLGAWLRISPSTWNQLPGPERLDTTDDVPIEDCGQEDGAS